MRRIATLVAVIGLLVAAVPAAAKAATNSPPVAVDDPGPACGDTSNLGGTFPVIEDWHDWQIIGIACGPLVNDSDPDGDPLTAELVGQPAHGQANVIPGTPSDWLEYRPDPDYSTPQGDWLSDVITYRAFDGQAYSNEASYRIWVAPVNDPPTFTSGPSLIEVHAGDGPVSIPWATDISPGPANESDQHVSFEIYVGAPDDTFLVNPAIDSDGTLTFTPGTRPWLTQVEVIAHDDGGLEDYNLSHSSPYDKPDDTSDPVTFEIAIYPALPAPPVAVDDTLTVLEDTPGHVGVIDNDTDVNGDNLALSGVGAAGKGTASKDDVEPWWVDYSPSPDANGTDSFTYTVSDGNGGTDTGTVHVTITPVNDDPVAVDDAVTVAQGAANVVLALAANDTDVDGDTPAVTDVGAAAHGQAVLDHGDVIYTPAAGYHGPDGFDYTVSDGAGGEDTGHVTITVAPDAAPPIVGSLGTAIGAGPIDADTVPVRLTWHGTDAVTGVAGYQVQRSVDGGSWRNVPLASPTATSVDRDLEVGTTTTFRVRATDGAGNTSAWVGWASIAPRRPQETASSIAWTGSWTRADDSRYSGGHDRHASRASRRAMFTFNGFAVGWVGRRSPSAGHAQVRIDGVLVATVDLSATSTRYRRIVFRSTLATSGRHTLEIRPVGDGRVDVDAFIVLR